jgi:CheY-like chemotaxis protein
VDWRAERSLINVIFCLQATKLITSRRDKGLNGHDFPTVFFVSAHATDSYREKALACGGVGFIAKPFQLPMIKDALQSVAIRRVSV